jgi:hypothetical protein
VNGGLSSKRPFELRFGAQTFKWLSKSLADRAFVCLGSAYVVCHGRSWLPGDFLCFAPITGAAGRASRTAVAITRVSRVTAVDV